MKRAEIAQRLEMSFEPIVEQLAALEHERWAHWQRHMHNQAQRRPDGSILVPADLVARWEKQLETPYAALTEAEKESDREQVRRYLPLIIATLCGG